MRSYFAWLVRNRKKVLTVIVVFVIVVGVAASRVPIDFTLEQFFPGWGPERERYERYKQSFPQEDMQVSVFWKDSRPAGAAVYRDLLSAAGFFEEVGLREITWFGNVEVAGGLAGGSDDYPRIHQLVERDSVSDSYIRDILARYRGDDVYRGYLWNADQSVFAIHSTLSEDDMGSDRRRREVEEGLQRRLEPLAGESAEFVVSGVPVTRSRVPKLLDQDQRLFVGAGVLVFLAVLLFFFRHLGQVLLCLASVLPAYLTTVAVIGLADKPVTVLTGFIPIIVLVVGGSDIVHLLTRYRRLRARRMENAGAIAKAFAELATPCFYTSLTTAIGFLSLVGTRIGIVIDFGVFTSLAIFLTFAFSMTLLPVLLSFYSKERLNSRGLEGRWIRGIVGAAAAVAARPSRRPLVIFGVVALASLGLALSMRVNSYLIDDLKRGAGVRRDLIWLEDNGFGIYQVVVFLRQTGAQPLHHPLALRWMEELREYVADEPVVVNSFALPNLLRPLRSAVVGVGEDEKLPQTTEEAARLISLAEQADSEFFSDVYRRSEGEAQVIVTVRDAGSQLMLPFLDKVDRYIEDNPLPDGSVYSTGTVKLIQNYSARVLRNFAPSLLLAIVLIFLVMSFLFRSLRQGLLALVPNLFPLLVLLSVMKLCGFDLKPSTILVCSIAFGLAVDDTIHLLGRFRRAIREGTALDAALTTSVRDAGPAIVMTTIVVSTGFSLLMFSRFEVLFLVGLMTVVAAVSAAAADLFVFPSVIAATWRSRSRSASDLDPGKGSACQGVGNESAETRSQLDLEPALAAGDRESGPSLFQSRR